MGMRIKQTITLLSAIGMLLVTCGCSIFVSTPRTAKICIQGLDNKLNEYVITLDEPVDETNVGFRISKNYTLQLDFEWLWDSGTDNRIMNNSQCGDEIESPLVPWFVCKYRF
jgi:hypothetical protein